MVLFRTLFRRFGSSRSSRRPDSELNPCADDTDEPRRVRNLLAAIISRYHRNGICQSVEHCADTGCPRDRVESRNSASHSRCFEVGLIPNWSKDPKIAFKTINARAESVDTAPSPTSVQETALHGALRRFLRMEESRWRQNPAFDRDEQQFIGRRLF
jgi:hypothetical protein